MNLSGNKIVAASALFLAVNLANATAPDLVEFTSGTAAKAAEVNSNFDELKTYSAGLEDVIEAQAALITALEEIATAANTERTAQAALITALEEKATTANTERTAQTALIAALENKATAAEDERTALENKIAALEIESANLQTQVSALGGGDAYTIAVYGDGGEEPIGHTNEPNLSNDKQYMVLKTDHGMVAMRPRTDSYELYDYDALDNETGSRSVYFTDNACSIPVAVFNTNPIGNSMFFTTAKGTTDKAIIATSNDAVYLAEAGTVFSDTSIDFYYKDGDDCIIADFYAGSIYLPVVEMTEGLHNLKHTYSTISLEGYETN